MGRLVGVGSVRGVDPDGGLDDGAISSGCVVGAHGECDVARRI